MILEYSFVAKKLNLVKLENAEPMFAKNKPIVINKSIMCFINQCSELIKKFLCKYYNIFVLKYAITKISFFWQ